MKYDPAVHHRRSIRLPDYNYSQASEYFITLVTHQREHIFGEVRGGSMILNPLGQIAAAEWLKTTQLRPYVELHPDEYIIMPNHIHGIIHIIDHVDLVRAQRRCAPTDNRCAPTDDQHPPAPNVTPHSLAAIVRAYKSAVTYAINTLNDTRGFSAWQRNYYEHIINSEKETLRIQAYIKNNPANWLNDNENALRGK